MIKIGSIITYEPIKKIHVVIAIGREGTKECSQRKCPYNIIDQCKFTHGRDMYILSRNRERGNCYCIPKDYAKEICE